MEEAHPPHGTVLGHGSFGRVTLHKESAACFALKSVPHRLLQSRNMEKALHIEPEALARCGASPFIACPISWAHPRRNRSGVGV